MEDIKFSNTWLPHNKDAPRQALRINGIEFPRRREALLGLNKALIGKLGFQKKYIHLSYEDASISE